MIPGWLLGILAALMLVVAAVSAARLAAGRRGGPRSDADIDVAHTLMGVAMAGTLAGSLQTLPDGAWAGVFAVLTGWFCWRVRDEIRADGARAIGTGHHLPHLVHAAAMVYMFIAVTEMAAAPAASVTGMAAGAGGMGTLRAPAIGLLFILFMAAWTVWDVDQIGAVAARIAIPAGGPQARTLQDPRVAVACRIAMGVAMAFMLVVML